MKLKKKNFICMIMILLVCILPIICICMLQHASLCQTLTRMGSGTLGEQSCLITLDKNTPVCRKALFESLQAKEISCAIYLDDKEDVSVTTRYMAYTESYPNMPMIQGRFFEKDDFAENSLVAVVGKNVEDTYTEDGKNYVQVKGQEYQVIGTIGYDGDTAFDNYVFVPLFSCTDEMLNLYTIDFFSEDITIEEILRDSQEMLKRTDSKLEQLAETANFADTVAIDFDAVGYFIGLLVCYVLCIILISYQWLMIQRRELCIRRLLGASQGQVVGRVLLQYLGFMLLSFGTGSLYCNLWYPSYRASFYQGYGICFGILFLFMVVTVWIVKKDSIEERIKQCG